jgi:isopenicillin N synthase-like dioxygenase
MHVYTPAEPPSRIPVLNLSRVTQPGGMADAARDMHRACRETGFFYVSGHGVPQILVRQQFAHAQTFFGLPLAEKMQLHMKLSPTAAGYEPIGAQVLDSQDKTAEKGSPDIKESFYIGREISESDPLWQRRQRGYGHNQWPAGLPDFRAQMLAYHRALTLLGERILSVLAVSLELDADWFAPFYNPGSAVLRLLHYPPHPAKAGVNQLGAGAHTDWGGITILAQDDAGGLEVQTVDGRWIQAPPIPDTFVINLGDLMARWTNGIYRSNFHRVKNMNPDRDRYSVPFFFSPFPDSRIEPMPTCVAADRPQQFATCTAAEHMLEMFRRSYDYAPR